MAYSLMELGNRLEVEDVIVRLFVATDERDWTTLESCFTDSFLLDMTSLVGGTPITMKPSDVSSAWATGFKPLDHVHHQVSNFQTIISGDSATVKCHGVAFHHRAQISTQMKTRIFVGTYLFDLTKSNGRWLVTRLKFDLKFLDGNLELEKSI